MDAVPPFVSLLEGGLSPPGRDAPPPEPGEDSLYYHDKKIPQAICLGDLFYS